MLRRPRTARTGVANLVGNALRYSPADAPPHLTGSASATGSSSASSTADRASRPTTGTGCSLPFQRLGDTDNTTGVGLGLALSRGLTEAMGGTLDPEDTPGGGLTMVVSLPARHRPAPTAGAPPSRASRGGQSMTRVLVVDDEPQILRALSINLRARRYEVHTAADGARRCAAAATRRTWWSSTWGCPTWTASR